MFQPFPLPFEQLKLLTTNHPTPFHIYCTVALKQNSTALFNAFKWAPHFINFFAVKANPNPYILSELANLGHGADASSLPELILAHKSGLDRNGIFFSSNDTPPDEFTHAANLNAVINFDDISHTRFLDRIPKSTTISFRYNPADLSDANFPFIGQPSQSKYGLTRHQIFQAFQIAKDAGFTNFAIHSMIASNQLSISPFSFTADFLFNLAVQLHLQLGINFRFINLGGGIGVNYHPDDPPFDYNALSDALKSKFFDILVPNDLGNVTLAMENGRAISASAGWLVAKVLHVKHSYKSFVGLDASMADLMRPALYNAYHHISVPGKDHLPLSFIADVTGSLCENIDKFAIDRHLPPIQPGDLIIIHHSGAHGHTMGFNYNGKLRHAELLINHDHSISLIRRNETERR